MSEAASHPPRLRPPRLRPPRLRLKRPAIQQHSAMDCGAACLATVSAYWGRRFSLNRMREHARVGREGATLANLRRAAREIGFEAEPMECPAAHLADQTLPAIANWKGYHWIVVYDVGPSNVTLADPAKGLICIPRDEFDQHFTGYCLTMTPTPAFLDQKSDPSPIWNMLRFYRQDRRQIFELFIAAIAIQIIAISVPLFSKFLMDNIILGGAHQWLWGALIAVAGITVMETILSWAREELAISVSASAIMRLSGEVFARLVKLPIGYFLSRKAGDVTSRLGEQEKVSDFVTIHAAGIVINLIAALSYLSIMIWFSAPLALIAVSFTVLHIGVIRVISPRLRQGFSELFEKGADQESHLLESLRGVETIKSTGAAPFARWRFADLYAARANTELRIAGWSTGSDMMVGFIGHLAAIAVLFSAAHMVFDGEMSIGVLVAFTMFAGALFGPLAALVGSWDEYQETLNGIERLNDILDKAPEYKSQDQSGELIRLPRPRGALSFQRVAFRYHPDDRANVLQNFTLDIKAGETVAFVGRSGCGKSTVLKLAFGLLRPTSGNILIDGFDVDDLWLPSYRSHIGCVPQKAMMFAGSVRDNIALARPDAALADLWEAARLADADGFISELPGGMNAPVAEAGTNFSGGQRQRIALARAFLQRPSVLLLDEATSALDTAGEEKVMASLREAFNGRTVLIVAHRLSTIRTADRIVVLNRGMVAEEGSHDALLETGSLYRALASAG